MLIYNVTINIDHEVHQEWLQWMRTEHIPEMLATQKFLSARMCKVLSEEDRGGITYAIQYTTESREILEDYYQNYAPKMRAKGHQKFPGKFVAFRTELELIEIQE